MPVLFYSGLAFDLLFSRMKRESKFPHPFSSVFRGVVEGEYIEMAFQAFSMGECWHHLPRTQACLVLSELSSRALIWKH